MATAGTVTIRLDGDSATLIRELNKANEAASSTFGQIQKDAVAVAEKFAYIATAAGIAFAALTKHSFEAVDALAKQADRLGITTESLKTMQVAADLAGVAQETLVKSLQKQQKLLVSAADGSKEAADTFRQLGLNVQDVIALPADQQFQKIAAALDGVENVSRRNALALQIWGDRAAEMINFAAEAGSSVGDLSTTLADLNVTVSRFDAAKIEQANDAVSVAKLAFEGLGNTIAVAVAPYVTALAEQFTEAARSSGGFKDQVATAMQFVANAVGFAGDTIRGLEVIFKSVAAAGLYAAGALAKAFGFLFDSKAMQEFGDNARGAAADLGREVAEALNRPMPSVAIDKWFADAKAKADAAGAEVAAKMAGAGRGAPDTIGQNDAAQAESLRKWLEQTKADAANAKAIEPKVITPEIKPGDFLPDPAVSRQFGEMAAQQYLEAWQLANQQRAEAEDALRATLFQSDEQAGQALIELAAEQARQKVQAEFIARGEAMAENGQFLDPQAQAEYEAQVQAEALSREQVFLQQRLALQQKFGGAYAALQKASAAVFGSAWTKVHKDTLVATAGFANSALSIAQNLFGQNKAFALGMAVVDTIRMAVAAGADTPGPWPVKAAAVAAALSQGYAQVQAIRSAGFGGGSGVTGVAGGYGGGAVSSPQSLGGFQGDGTDKTANAQVTIQFNGNMVGWDRYVQENVIGAIRDAVDGKDVVLFGGTSRQAQIIRGAG